MTKAIRTRCRPEASLRLEPLEDRTCPSFTSLFADGLLTVRGGALGDLISITAVRIHEYRVNGAEANFREVYRIFVDLGGGNDTLRLDLVNNSSVDLRVLGGDGDDSIDIDLGPLRQGTDFHLDADLGAGDDQLRLTAGDVARQATANLETKAGDGNDSVQQSVGTVRRDAVVSSTSELGSGDDQFAFVARGVDAGGDVTVLVDPGTGTDTVVVDLGNVEAGAKVRVESELAAGKEEALLDASRIGPNVNAPARINGADGADSIRFPIVTIGGSGPLGGEAAGDDADDQAVAAAPVEGDTGDENDAALDQVATETVDLGDDDHVAEAVVAERNADPVPDVNGDAADSPELLLGAGVPLGPVAVETGAVTRPAKSRDEGDA